MQDRRVTLSVSIRRVLVALSTAVILSQIPITLAAAWSPLCGPDDYKWCIYANDNHQLPVAAMNGSLNNYNNGAKYYNTEILINDSANGSANWYSSTDVQVYKAAHYAQWDRCTDSGGGWWTIGFFNNDTWSSHLLVSDNAC